MMRILPQPNFKEILATNGLSMTDLATAADVPAVTVYAAVNPSTDKKRQGGWRPATAWKLAEAFARLRELDKHEAFALLFVIPMAQSTQELASSR